MLALQMHLLTVLAWCETHPLLALGLAASILGTLANSLSHFPRAQAVVLQFAAFLSAALRFIADAMALVANANGRGLVGPLTLPGVPTLAPKLTVLLLLLGLSWPAGAQELPPPCPVRQFGGCTMIGHASLSYGPAATVSLVRYSFRGASFDGGFIPSAGYELAMWSDRPYAVSAGFFTSFKLSGTQDVSGCAIGSFARYVRFGGCWNSLLGWQLIGGLGADFGAPDSKP